MLIVVAGLAVIVITILWLFVYAGPVLYVYRDPASVSQDPSLVLMNPFRERSPELVAERLFEDLMSGNCIQTLEQMPLEQSAKNEICSREHKARIKSWSLRDRGWQGEDVTLQYSVWRVESVNAPSSARIRLQRVSDVWRIADLDFIY